ncbi:MAG: sugar-binding protein [Lentisphaeria bacterium]|nr:sugar-binding protein [Lentisphaeria bacterium]
MKKAMRHAGLCFLFLFLTKISLSARALPAVPELKIPFLEQSASIDGEFNESCWQNAALVENFVNHLEPHEPQQRTSLLMFHNGQSLFFGFTCYDSQMQALQKMQAETKYDGSLWVNDCVEIFIGSTENPHLFQQFIVNWRGAGFDSFEAFGRAGIKPSRWNACWRRAVQLKDDSWQVEVEIPFFSINFPSTAHELRVNFFREKYNTPGEYSAWSCPYNQLFNQPERFGKLSGIQRPVREISILEQEIKWPLFLSTKKNIISCTLASQAEQPWSGSLVAAYCLPGEAQLQELGSWPVSLQPGQWNTCSVEFDWERQKSDISVVLGLRQSGSDKTDWQLLNTLLSQEAFIVGLKPVVLYQKRSATTVCVLNETEGVEEVGYEILDAEKRRLKTGKQPAQPQTYLEVESGELPPGGYLLRFNCYDRDGKVIRSSAAEPLWITIDPFKGK